MPRPENWPRTILHVDLEITLPLRELQPLDASDADLTVRAAIEEEDRRLLRGEGRLKDIESIWRAKGDLIAAHALASPEAAL